MRCTVKTEDLAKALALLKGIVPTGVKTIKILEHVLLSADRRGLHLSATDLDVSIRCQCAAEVEDLGAVAIDAHRLFALVKACDPESSIEFDVDDQARTAVKCGAASLRLAGLDAAEFPQIPGATDQAVELAGADVRALLSRVACAMPTTDARFVLAAAYFEIGADYLEAAATDGHRMATARRPAKVKVEKTIAVLLPRKFVRDVVGLLPQDGPVTFSHSDSHLALATSAWTMTSRTIEGQFPAYKRVLEKQPTVEVAIGREAFERLLRRVNIVVNADERPSAKLTLAPKKLSASTASADAGQADDYVAVEYAGGEKLTALNIAYVQDFLAVADAPEVLMGFRDSSEDQILLRPKGESVTDYRYVVMPVRV